MTININNDVRDKMLNYVISIVEEYNAATNIINNTENPARECEEIVTLRDKFWSRYNTVENALSILGVYVYLSFNDDFICNRIRIRYGNSYSDDTIDEITI